jgi:hypothetical protein
MAYVVHMSELELFSTMNNVGVGLSDAYKAKSTWHIGKYQIYDYNILY